MVNYCCWEFESSELLHLNNGSVSFCLSLNWEISNEEDLVEKKKIYTNMNFENIFKIFSEFFWQTLET